MKIHITGSFYIETGGKSYTLKEEYDGQTRDGRPRKGQRTHGYFRSISDAVGQCLSLNTLNGAKAVELWEYAKMVEDSNKTAVQAIQKELSTILKSKEE